MHLLAVYVQMKAVRWDVEREGRYARLPLLACRDSLRHDAAHAFHSDRTCQTILT